MIDLSSARTVVLISAQQLLIVLHLFSFGWSTQAGLAWRMQLWFQSFSLPVVLNFWCDSTIRRGRRLKVALVSPFLAIRMFVSFFSALTYKLGFRDQLFQKLHVRLVSVHLFSRIYLNNFWDLASPDVFELKRHSCSSAFVILLRHMVVRNELH